MHRCRMSSGPVATREAPLGYARVHSVAERWTEVVGRGGLLTPQVAANRLHCSLASVWELQTKCSSAILTPIFRVVEL